MNFTNENQFLIFIILTSKASGIDWGMDNWPLSGGWTSESYHSWSGVPDWVSSMQMEYNLTESLNHITKSTYCLCHSQKSFFYLKWAFSELHFVYISCDDGNYSVCIACFLNAKIKWRERENLESFVFVVKCTTTPFSQDVHKAVSQHVFGTTHWSASAPWDLGQGSVCADVQLWR